MRQGCEFFTTLCEVKVRVLDSIVGAKVRVLDSIGGGKGGSCWVEEGAGGTR